MGAPRHEACIAGHDLTDEDNVKLAMRNGKYLERQCLPCQRARAREWWRKNRGKS